MICLSWQIVGQMISLLIYRYLGISGKIDPWAKRSAGPTEHAAGWEANDLNDLAHIAWFGSVLTVNIHILHNNRRDRYRISIVI